MSEHPNVWEQIKERLPAKIRYGLLENTEGATVTGTKSIAIPISNPVILKMVADTDIQTIAATVKAVLDVEIETITLILPSGENKKFRTKIPTEIE